jgi:ATP:cob(I)alamin adenosyltransferase
MAKSYTGKGDGGISGLGNGERARKSEPIFDALGMLDELNSLIGIAALKAGNNDEQLEQIQQDLLEAGSIISGYSRGEFENFEHKVKRLERWIDSIDERLPPLENFILPGGCEIAASLHHCRTVCRRAERAIEKLEDNSKSKILPYLNRLSSYFFARARFENMKAGVKEKIWKKQGTGKN